MRRYIVLLLITGTVWAQTGLDKLVLKDGTIYLGEYSKIEKNKVYFKPSEGFAFQGVSISQIKSLKLKDGKTIIKDEYEKIRTILDYKNLSIEDKAIYDAKKDAKRNPLREVQRGRCASIWDMNVYFCDIYITARLRTSSAAAWPGLMEHTSASNVQAFLAQGDRRGAQAEGHG